MFIELTGLQKLLNKENATYQNKIQPKIVEFEPRSVTRLVTSDSHFYNLLSYHTWKNGVIDTDKWNPFHIFNYFIQWATRRSVPNTFIRESIGPEIGVEGFKFRRNTDLEATSFFLLRQCGPSIIFVKQGKCSFIKIWIWALSLWVDVTELTPVREVSLWDLALILESLSCASWPGFKYLLKPSTLPEDDLEKLWSLWYIVKSKYYRVKRQKEVQIERKQIRERERERVLGRERRWEYMKRCVWEAGKKRREKEGWERKLGFERKGGSLDLVMPDSNTSE